jgi:hypothetical protein
VVAPVQHPISLQDMMNHAIKLRVRVSLYVPMYLCPI